MDNINVNEFINELDLEYREPKFCMECFTTLTEFLNTGFLGCSNCYKVFEKEIKNYINSTQYSSYHNGKLCFNGKKTNAQKRELLEKELSQAILEQRFVDCQAIKQKLDELKEND